MTEKLIHGVPADEMHELIDHFKQLTELERRSGYSLEEVFPEKDYEPVEGTMLDAFDRALERSIAKHKAKNL
ncbi:hypothetical protein ACMXYX_17775 (plasmid) [Neptuniibacter sp. QD72_48]|uniref:hypothetical protein n=1 Tax=Neptuniibacter sp. QD72_48 TaxID=3398214 RepID=UPI0039F5F09B